MMGTYVAAIELKRGVEWVRKTTQKWTKGMPNP